MEEKKLYKSRTDRKFCGVCGGIAKYFGIDATILRIIWLVCIFGFGFGGLVYLIAALVMQDEPTYVEKKDE